MSMTQLDSRKWYERVLLGLDRFINIAQTIKVKAYCLDGFWSHDSDPHRFKNGNITMTGYYSKLYIW